MAFPAGRRKHSWKISGDEAECPTTGLGARLVSDDQYKVPFDQMRQSKGDEFDEYAARAIRVHAREGVSETAACQGEAMHPELKQFCSDRTLLSNALRECATMDL